MGRWLVNTLFQGVGLMLIARILSPDFYVANLQTALLAAVVITLIFRFVRPFFTILTLPLQIITLGLFRVVVNGLMFHFAASFLGSGFYIANFKTAIMVSILYSIFQFFCEKITRDERRRYYD